MITCTLVISTLGLLAQNALPPSQHGGNPNRTIDLRNPQAGTIQKVPEYNFDKQNPRHRALAPKTRSCQTEEVEQELSAFSSDATESDTLFEQWMQQSIREKQRSRSLFRFGPEEVLTIPTVVHVIYASPLENISDAQVYSQITSLNADYRRQNTDQSYTPRQFRNLATDTGIEFCLASVDPRGQPTNGIHRVSFTGAPFTERYMNEVIKPATIWDPNRYFNVWVCHLANDVLGFASFPVSSGLSGVPTQRTGANTDGVVIHYSVFGTTGTVTAPFNKGRTATHEVGHWLGLRHIWGDGPCGVDDFVGDTPESAGPHFGCQSGATDCRGSVAMIQNYMDYSDDACMNLFTKEQKARMRLVLRNSPRRGSLLDSDVCRKPITPPEPAFAANIQQGCAPLNVTFTDRSRGEEMSYQWTFPGGRPGTSNQASPQVQYREPGVYLVSLRVTNPAGSRSVTREGFITVTSAGTKLPFLADFEPTTATSRANYFLENPDNDYTWTITERIGAGGLSAQSLTMNHFDNKLVNSADWFILPVIDMGTESSPELSFDLSYGPYNSKFSDTLGIFIATGCGTLFRSIYYKGGAQLSTVGDRQVLQPFTPDGREWRRERIDLSQLAGISNVQIAFVTFNGNGNDLYLDNIRVGSPLPPAPVPQFSVSVQQACAGEDIKFEQRADGEITQVTWSFPGGSPASSSSLNPVVRYAEAGSYDVILSVRGPGGEKSITKTGVITITGAPPILLAGDREICEGESLTLSASGADEYQWMLGEAIMKEGNSGSFSFSPKKDDVLTVIGRIGLCEAKKTIPIRVRAVRPLAITPAAVEICPGEEVTLQATGAQQYSWSPSEAEPQSQSGTLRVSPIETTTYRVAGVNESGCALSAEITVVVHQSPQELVVTAPKQQICPGESVQLTASGASSFRWSPTIGLNQSEGATVVSTPDITTTYRIEATNEFGCRISKELTIEVTPYPEVQVRSLAPVVCAGADAMLQARGGLTYEWYPAALVSGQGSEVVGRPEENQVFTVIGKTAAGCADTAQVFVEVLPSAPLTITASNYVVCRGGEANLSVSGANSYEWASAQGLVNNRGSQVTVRPIRDETYIVYGTDSRGCESSASVKISVSEGRSAYADFSAAKTITCAGQEIQFQSQSRDAVGFRWEFEGGTPQFSTEPNPKVTYPYEGSYSVRLEVIGCDRRTDRNERTDYMYVTEPTDIRLNTSDRVVCRGEQITLGASGGRSYSWAPATGLDRTTGATVIAQPLSTTTYTLTGRDAEGCMATRKVTLEVVSAQVVTVSPTAAAVCKGDSVRLEARGAIDYAWTGPALRSNLRQPSFFAKPTQSTTYRLSATDINGCAYTKEVRVEVSDSISLSLSADRYQVCEGDMVNLSASGASVVTWSPANVLSAATGTDIEAFPRETTTFFVSATNEAGCNSRKSITIEVEPVTPVTLMAQDSIICPGQGTLLTANGGTGYDWSPSIGLSQAAGPIVTASPAQTTTYTVSRSEGGCGGSAQITLEVREPEPLVISPTVAKICEGDQVKLTVTGGTRYVWELAEGLSTVAGKEVMVTPTFSTQYVVRSLDERNCELMGTASVVVTPADFVTLSTSASTVCAGEEVILNAEGAESYQWLEDPTLSSESGERVFANPTIGTIYSVVGTNEEGCMDTASVDIFVREFEADFLIEPSKIDLAAGPGLVQFQGELEGAMEYAWYFGENGTSTEPNPMHVFAQPGRYEIQFAASDGICVTRTRQDFVVENSSSIEELQDEGPISVSKQGDGMYQLSLYSTRDMYLKLRMMNDEGIELLSGAIRPGPGAYTQNLDLKAYPAGTYYIRLSDGEMTETIAFTR